MPALPAKGNLDGTTAGHTTGMFEAAIGDLRDFLATLFGTSGTKVDAQKTLGVAVVDRAYDQAVGYNSLSPTIAITNSIPQVTQGTQFLTASLTPKSTTNRLRARIHVPWSTGYATAGSQDFLTLAIFVNGAANAVAGTQQSVAPDGSTQIAYLEFEWVPGVLTAQVVTVRGGCGNGNLILCGNRFSPLLGGTTRATLTLEEITA